MTSEEIVHKQRIIERFFGNSFQKKNNVKIRTFLDFRIFERLDEPYLYLSVKLCIEEMDWFTIGIPTKNLKRKESFRAVILSIKKNIQEYIEKVNQLK